MMLEVAAAQAVEHLASGARRCGACFWSLCLIAMIFSRMCGPCFVMMSVSSVIDVVIEALHERQEALADVLDDHEGEVRRTLLEELEVLRHLPQHELGRLEAPRHGS
jgi:hypothetical protein